MMRTTFKTFSNVAFQRRFFWTTIFIGLSLPIVLMIAVDSVQGRKSFADTITSTVSYFFSSLTGIGFLYWFFHGLVFVLLAFLIRSKFKDTSKDNVLRIATVLGAWGFAVGFSLFVNLSILISDSSTAAIGYIFAPFYMLLSILVGNACGWIVGKILLKTRYLANK